MANDPDNPELPDEELARMRPAREVLPPELYEALTRNRAKRDRDEPAKQEHVTIPLDRAVLDHFRAAGPEWPGLINEALKKAIGSDRDAALGSRVE
jgi:uncharacterized protein (DUF4415 family)